MRKLPMIFPLFLLVATAMAEPVLPSWRENGQAAEASEKPAVILPPPVDEAEANEAVVEIDLPQPPPLDTVDDVSPYTAVPEEYWAAYFGERPSSFLIDPQRLLAPADFRERLAFLNYHSGDSGIDLYVYIFDGDQEIPAEVRDEELMERFFTGGRPVALVYYFLGEPQRAELKLAPSLAVRIPAPQRHRTLESPMIQASKEYEPARQFETFLVQMSIRLYWLETQLAEESETPDRPAKAATPEPAAQPGLMDAVAPLIEHVKPQLMPLLALAGGLLLVVAAAWWLRRRARYQFPDLEVEPRLGGAHAAGVGAVISFASASESPATQREQMPGYLQRVR